MWRHDEDISSAKQRIRRKVWKTLEDQGLATYPRPCFGSIPNFRGNMTASWKLIRTDIFRRAEAVYISMDPAEKVARESALMRGKILVSSTPRFRRGLIVVNPENVPMGAYSVAASLRGALRYGEVIYRVKDLRLLRGLKIDLVILGSVAVTADGGRIGKGDGQGDLAYGVLKELGLIDNETPVATIVHDVQIIDEIPMERHDAPVDYIFTPSQALKTQCKYPKPPGVIWDKVTVDMMKVIPLLGVLSGFEGVTP